MKFIVININRRFASLVALSIHVRLENIVCLIYSAKIMTKLFRNIVWRNVYTDVQSYTEYIVNVLVLVCATGVFHICKSHNVQECDS